MASFDGRFFFSLSLVSVLRGPLRKQEKSSFNCLGIHFTVCTPYMRVCG